MDSCSGTSRDLPNFVRRILQDSLLQVHILAIEGQRFADAHSGHRQESKDRRVRASLQPLGRSELACRLDKLLDLRIAIDVRPLAAITVGKEASGRYFGTSICRAEPDGETSYHPEARSPGCRLCLARFLGPPKCQVRRDVGSTLSLGKRDEASKSTVYSP